MFHYMPTYTLFRYVIRSLSISNCIQRTRTFTRESVTLPKGWVLSCTRARTVKNDNLTTIVKKSRRFWPADTHFCMCIVLEPLSQSVVSIIMSVGVTIDNDGKLQCHVQWLINMKTSSSLRKQNFVCE